MNLRQILPPLIFRSVRKTATAFGSPFMQFYASGHFRSAFAMRAMDRHGNPLPWYTYPAITMLQTQSFVDKVVHEFGAGQSGDVPLVVEIF